MEKLKYKIQQISRKEIKDTKFLKQSIFDGNATEVGAVDHYGITDTLTWLAEEDNTQDPITPDPAAL